MFLCIRVHLHQCHVCGQAAQGAACRCTVLIEFQEVLLGGHSCFYAYVSPTNVTSAVKLLKALHVGWYIVLIEFQGVLLGGHACFYAYVSTPTNVTSAVKLLKALLHVGALF